MPEAVAMRLVLLGIAGVVAVVLGAFFGLHVLWPASVIEKPPALAQRPPLQPITRTSTVVAPAAISLSAIQGAIESAAPRNVTGNRSGSTRKNPTNINVEWVVNRGPFAVSTRS